MAQKQRPKIEVRHTSIIVNEYTLGDSKKLEYFFSMWVKRIHKRVLKGVKFHNGKLFLPRGMDVFKVEQSIGHSATLDQSCDPIAKIEPVMLSVSPRDEKQRIGVNFVIGQAEYSKNRPKSQLSVNLKPGAGKTYLAVVMAAFFQIRTAVITDKISVLQQWKSRIMRYTDTKDSEIYFIEGSGSILRLLNGARDINKIKFVLCSHTTLKSYGDSKGWDKVGRLFKFMGIGLKIFDEAHRHFTNMMDIDYATNTFKTLYLTATPLRSEIDEDIIYQECFRNVPKLDLWDEATDPHTHFYAFHYNSRPSPVDIENCRTANGFSAVKYADYVVHRPNFYELLFILLEIAKTKGKTLFYIAKNSSIDRIYDWIMYTCPELNGRVGIYNSTVPAEMKAAMTEKDIILTTIQSCGEAVDIYNLKMVVCLASPFQSPIFVEQTFGRCRDYDTMYILVVDSGFPTIRAYYRNTAGIFARYAMDMNDVYLKDPQLHESYRDMFQNKMQFYYSMYKNQKRDRIEVIKLTNDTTVAQ